MKLLIILGILIAAVLVCEKYEKLLPPPISWLFALWKKFAHVLGVVMNTVILSILWIVGFGIYAIIIKMATLCKTEKQDTFWIDAEVQTDESFSHQF